VFGDAAEDQGDGREDILSSMEAVWLLSELVLSPTPLESIL
jgi:hypothetical protein